MAGASRHTHVRLLTVTYDLYFWKAGFTSDPANLAGQLAKQQAERVPADPAVLAFRADILSRWPEHADRIEAWHSDLGWRQAGSSRTDIADRYVIMTLPYRLADLSGELALLAKQHGLDCYDPQANSFR
jgi:hypothetical protein